MLVKLTIIVIPTYHSSQIDTNDDKFGNVKVTNFGIRFIYYFK